MTKDLLRIAPEKMQEVLYRLFSLHGFPVPKARFLARIHTESSLDGVNSHGINRVALFIEYVGKGVVKAEAEAEKVSAMGSMERWEGHRGPGIINASKCTTRASELAKLHGMGLVALRNTNHWMRGGTYGWQAAGAGCMAILFTNTIANMPPWGGRESRIGNNPLIIAIPRKKKHHVVLDMALSQFAFGKIHDCKLRGEVLPFPGGWDEQNQLTRDPEKILASERGLPIGYWKGSALSMVLDILATLLSEGDSTGVISARGLETGISQVFLCMYPGLLGQKDLQDRLLEEILDYTKAVEPMDPDSRAYYPGERTWLTRKRNLKEGIPVSEQVWNKVVSLANAPS
jgi:3-dehydro-L-gulonate 2-dehydrogenase